MSESEKTRESHAKKLADRITFLIVVVVMGFLFWMRGVSWASIVWGVAALLFFWWAGAGRIEDSPYYKLFVVLRWILLGAVFLAFFT